MDLWKAEENLMLNEGSVKMLILQFCSFTCLKQPNKVHGLKLMINWSIKKRTECEHKRDSSPRTTGSCHGRSWQLMIFKGTKRLCESFLKTNQDLSHRVFGLQMLGLKINPQLHGKPMYFCLKLEQHEKVSWSHH